jgi:hypothetical protein
MDKEHKVVEEKDRTTNIGDTPNACGGWSEKNVDGLEEDEGIGWNKPGGMGMMGKWMEVGT